MKNRARMVECLQRGRLAIWLAVAIGVVPFAIALADEKDEEPNFRPPGEESTLDTGPVHLKIGGFAVAPTWISGDPGFGFGMQTLRVFHVGEPGANLPSTHRALVLYTLKGRWRLETRTDLYWGEGRWFARLVPHYDGLRAGFYGLGNPAPLDEPEYYEPRDFGVRAGLFRRLYRDVRVGLVYEWQHFKIHERELDGLLAANPDLIGQEGSISGLGLALEFDSRDEVFDPAGGIFGQLTVIGFPDQLGGRHDFTDYELDLRTYIALAPAHTLALQGYAWLSRGGTPYWRLPSLGDLPHSRAYDLRRQRDKTLGGLQAEWRWRWSQRFGFEVFAGAVGLDTTLRQLRLGEMKPSLGASLRLYRDIGGDIVPMRFGGAWGDDGWRMVIGVGDAF